MGTGGHHRLPISRPGTHEHDVSARQRVRRRGRAWRLLAALPNGHAQQERQGSAAGDLRCCPWAVIRHKTVEPGRAALGQGPGHGVPVPAGQPALRVALALGHPGELGDLRLHDRLGEHPDTLAQEVDVTSAIALRTVSSTASCLRPLRLLRVVGSYSNDERMTVAAPFFGQSAVTPRPGTQPPRRSFTTARHGRRRDRAIRRHET